MILVVIATVTVVIFFAAISESKPDTTSKPHAQTFNYDADYADLVSSTL